MAIVRFEPIRELAALQSEMGRFMNEVWGATGSADSHASWLPPVDVWETESEIVLALDLPGLDESNIAIEIDEGTLTVSGERERTDAQTETRYHRFERRFGQFSRSVALPPGIDESKVAAEFKHGVLEIRVPKPEERKPTRIQIDGQDNATIEGEAIRS
jgi:HSP20 family protein